MYSNGSPISLENRVESWLRHVYYLSNECIQIKCVLSIVFEKAEKYKEILKSTNKIVE